MPERRMRRYGIARSLPFGFVFAPKTWGMGGGILPKGERFPPGRTTHPLRGGWSVLCCPLRKLDLSFLIRFSQGQRTKVALARSLVHGPQNIILDEPSNGLDVMATRSLRELIRALKKAGKCVLFSSHVMQEVAALCDEIVIIAAGRVALQDSPGGIRNKTGCEDLEEAFVKVILAVEPA